MDRQEKIKILEALAAGKGLEGIGKRVPPSFAAKFHYRADLEQQLRVIYGQSVKLLSQKGQYYVVGATGPGMWMFYQSPDKEYCYGMLKFAEPEYRQLIKEIDEIDGFVEEKTYADDKVITFVRQPGNDPLENI